MYLSPGHLLVANPADAPKLPRPRTSLNRERSEAGRNLSPLWRADGPSERPCYSGAVRPDISLTSCRPMTKRWISFVPSPISHTLASRIIRSTG